MSSRRPCETGFWGRFEPSKQEKDDENQKKCLDERAPATFASDLRLGIGRERCVMVRTAGEGWKVWLRRKELEIDDLLKNLKFSSTGPAERLGRFQRRHWEGFRFVDGVEQSSP